MLPFGVLVVRLVTTPLTSDATVAAAELLRSLERGGAWPARRDESWRWPVPSTRGEVVEVIPATDVERVARAASVTLREASTQGLGGRRVGERVLRDALLDHVPIVVTTATGQRLDVPQRLVQAVVRMGFLRPAAATLTGADTEGDNSVTVRSAGRWISLECSYGSAWYLATSPLRLS